ncbi:MAG: hypothetical protein WCD18_16395, partial [Thermosynechococcaceae cyanobacterium]
INTDNDEETSESAEYNFHLEGPLPIDQVWGGFIDTVPEIAENHQDFDMISQDNEIRKYDLDIELESNYPPGEKEFNNTWSTHNVSAPYTASKVSTGTIRTQINRHAESVYKSAYYSENNEVVFTDDDCTYERDLEITGTVDSYSTTQHQDPSNEMGDVLMIERHVTLTNSVITEVTYSDPRFFARGNDPFKEPDTFLYIDLETQKCFWGDRSRTAISAIEIDRDDALELRSQGAFKRNVAMIGRLGATINHLILKRGTLDDPISAYKSQNVQLAGIKDTQAIAQASNFKHIVLGVEDAEGGLETEPNHFYAIAFDFGFRPIKLKPE